VWLARLLTQAGAEVDVVMTRSAQEFVGGVTFEAVTGRPVHKEIFGPALALDHIRLARESAVICIAPVTAEFLARAAHGNADDLLSAVLLATRSPVLMVPAMNDAMWSHPQTQANLARVKELGYHVLEPAEGELAVGEGSGPGRMQEPEVILEHVGRLLRRSSSLKGKSVLVTAGATREPLDPVRFISNHSSGKMGIAIAKAAWQRGAEVTLVHGHVDVPIPGQIRSVPVGTTQEMLDALSSEIPSADVLVMAAAPADFRALEVAGKKIKKGNAPPAITFAATPDILSETIPHRRDGMVAVGFALETDSAVDNGKSKLSSKKLDLIVVNNALEKGAGFGVDTNRVTLVSRDGKSEDLPLMSKAEVASQLLDRIEDLVSGR
jgi:phosphopantothenoylcysteine decarboxylase / phosphopantothenate---cysteine ligase